MRNIVIQGFIPILSLKQVDPNTDIHGVKNSWISQIATWNGLVRSGKGVQVSRELLKVSHSEIPKSILPQIANLCWRVSQAAFGIQLLFPYLRLKQTLGYDTGAESWSEYAACLLEIGAIEEAESILRKLISNSDRAKFQMALLHFRKWDYESAVPLLKSCLQNKNDDYFASVIEVNLASALVVTEQFEEAEEILKGLQSRLKDDGHHQLLGNTLEIYSQIPFAQGDYRLALEMATKSTNLLKESRNRGWLYSRKWQWINSLYIQRKVTTALENEFENLKRTANEMCSWETLRELDLHRGLVERNNDLLNKVYFGSPSKFYKERLRKKIGQSQIDSLVHNGYTLTNEGSPVPAPQAIDLLAKVMNSTGSLHSFLPKKLILHLFSDLYAPYRTGHLFSLLFPDDYFNPHSSPKRLFQIVKRSRLWLLQEELGAKIRASKHGYRIQVMAAGHLWLSRDLSDRVLSRERWDRSHLYSIFLRNSFGKTEFTAQNLKSIVRCSLRTSNRILQDLSKSSEVIGIGQGKLRKFRFAA